jgi:exopolysaccharide biosynthesis polyprenyl glycosylphosphotransferase
VKPEAPTQRFEPSPRTAAPDQRRSGSRKDVVRRRLLFLADTLCFLTAVGATTLVEGTSDPLWALLAYPLWIFLAKVEGLYDADHPKIWHLTTDEAPALFHWATLSAAGTLFYIRALETQTITLESAATMWLVALAGAFFFRAIARAIWRGLVTPERALVIGTGDLAEQVRRKLAVEPGHHVTLVEVATVPRNGTEPRAIRYEELGQEELKALLVEVQAERIILAETELDEPTLARIVSAGRAQGVKLSVVPPLRAMLGTAVELSHIAEMPVIEYRTWDPSRSTMAIKRLVDIVVSAAGLILLAPLMLVIAIAIRLDSRGPALFTQWRAGRNGRPFKILKFRTMCHDAQERIDEVISIERLDEPMYKLRQDPRVTKVGRLLRRTSLDELPQLINVLRGDMSLVGPRPEELWLVERYGETQRFRLEMRPGLTGPMQVHGRGELTFQERLAVEREYVENYSLRKDLRILLRTLSAVLRANGAY